MNGSMKWAAVLVLGAGSLLCLPQVRRLFHPVVLAVQGRRTVEDRVAKFGPARQRVAAQCRAAGVAYPPAKVVLLGLKQEKRLEVYAGDESSLRQIASYPILAASGAAGPKLREGDRQVPEGVYAVESLNPNSRYHVALRVNYPNDFDRRVARQESRHQLGGDIMIHGSNGSVGCLAMGDPAAEDLFILAAETGIANVTILLAPLDLRTHSLPDELNTDWRRELYAELTQQLARLK